MTSNQEANKQNTCDNMTVERAAGIMYYAFFKPEEHPDYNKYDCDDYNKFVFEQFPEINIIGILEIKRQLILKLLEINHIKARFFEDMEETFLYYNISEIHGLIELWYIDSMKRLAINRYNKLKPFPINSWYSTKKSYIKNKSLQRKTYERDNIQKYYTNNMQYDELL